jgi:hypothetical protein
MKWVKTISGSMKMRSLPTWNNVWLSRIVMRT